LAPATGAARKASSAATTRSGPYFREALRDGEAQQFALGTASHKAGLYLATRAAAGQAVVVVKLEFDAVESAWRAAPGVTYVTDRQGVILVASRPAWRFAATLPLAAETARAERLALGVAALPPAPFARTGNGLLTLAGDNSGPYLPVATAPDAAGWRLHLALPLAGAVEPGARGVQAVTALIVLLLGIATAALVERAPTPPPHRASGKRGRPGHGRTAQREQERAAAGRAPRLCAKDCARPIAWPRWARSPPAWPMKPRSRSPRSATMPPARPAARSRHGGQVRENLAAITRLADRIGAVTQHLRGFARKGSRGTARSRWPRRSTARG
jgi:two-component system C4-dicarboxylate transport sensor histidine kinase DctB